jgi:hypothetical protein
MDHTLAHSRPLSRRRLRAQREAIPKSPKYKPPFHAVSRAAWSAFVRSFPNCQLSYSLETFEETATVNGRVIAGTDVDFREMPRKVLYFIDPTVRPA